MNIPKIISWRPSTNNESPLYFVGEVVIFASRIGFILIAFAMVISRRNILIVAAIDLAVMAIGYYINSKSSTHLGGKNP